MQQYKVFFGFSVNRFLRQMQILLKPSLSAQGNAGFSFRKLKKIFNQKVSVWIEASIRKSQTNQRAHCRIYWLKVKEKLFSWRHFLFDWNRSPKFLIEDMYFFIERKVQSCWSQKNRFLCLPVDWKLALVLVPKNQHWLVFWKSWW